MDVYTKMCDCDEVQKDWKPKEGDKFYILEGYYSNGLELYNGEWTADKGEIVVIGSDMSVCNDYPDKQIRKDGSKFSFDNGKYIWLPRQEDIQKMIEDLAKYMFEEIYQPMDADYWIMHYNDIDNEELRMIKEDTWEQLWLAFYMKEKHNKIWTSAIGDKAKWYLEVKE